MTPPIRLPAALAGALALGACAGNPVVTSSGVRATGHDLYAVYVYMQGGGAADYTGQTRARALSDANDFCTRRGEGLATVTQEQQLQDKPSAVVVNFTCGG